MVYKLYCIKDECIGFSIPFAQENDGVAIRSFKHAFNNDEGIYKTKPNDFSLWCVGDFNNVTGEVNPLIPFRICEAVEFIEREVM